MAVRNGVLTRGTSNGNERGSSEDRRRRRAWLLTTYAADKKLIKVVFLYANGFTHTEVEPYVIKAEGMLEYDCVIEAVEVPTCRCYRCGKLLWDETLTVDRIIPGCKGGRYRRTNIRPACSGCNSETGAPLANGREHQAAKTAARKKTTKKGLVS